jgi:hypothetical protein
MVINILSIDSTFTTITCSLSADVGNKVLKVIGWTGDTYLDYNNVIDLTALLSGVDENEDFSITAADMGVESFAGFFAFEVYSDEAVSEESSVIGIVTNFLPYHECMLDKVLSITIKNCEISNDECGEKKEVLFISTVLDTLYDTMNFGLYEEAIQIIDTLNDLCEVCAVCPDLGEDLTGTGFGYKTVDNIITLV